MILRVSLTFRTVSNQSSEKQDVGEAQSKTAVRVQLQDFTRSHELNTSSYMIISDLCW